MDRWMRPWVASLVLVACSGESAPERPACGLSFDDIAGKSFVMLEAMPGNETRENTVARMRFEKKDGGIQLRYTAKNPIEVYTYDCDRSGEELHCAEPARLVDWCLAYETHAEGSCTAEKLKELGATRSTDEELAAAVKNAKDQIAQMKGSPNWAQFKLQHNNLGNALRGLVYAKIDKRTCRLTIDDMYMTVYDGKKVEDFNPVGRNAFVQTEGELLFEHCGDYANIADLDTAELPSDLSAIPAERIHEAGKEIHFFYVGEKASKPQEGCTYSMDVWAAYKPVARDVAVTADAAGKLAWTATHAFAESDLIPLPPSGHAGILHMVRSETCGAEKKPIDVVCSAARHP